MPYNNQQNEQMENQSFEPVKKGGKMAGRAAARRAGRLAAKAAKKALLGMLKILGVKGGIVLAIVLMAYVAFNVLFSFQGTNQQYSREHEGGTILSEDGILITTEELLSDEGRVVRDFYRYHSGISYYQIVGSDNEKLLSPDDPKAVQDYYRSADIFKLNTNLLFALDEYLFERRWRYPEQFIKPVHYDPSSLTLKPLVDEDGVVISESKEQDVETGKETGRIIHSVRDYGLASIVRYNSTEDWTKTVSLKGAYDYKDVWNSDLGRVVRVAIDPEPFEFLLPGYPQPIHLVEKVVSFAGEVEYFYEYRDTKVSDLAPGVAERPNQASEMVHYATHYEPDCYFLRDLEGEIILDEMGMPIEFCREPKEHKLYKHRSPDSGIYERIPVEVSVTTNEKGISYLRDYIQNFESYIPEDVIADFDFTHRIDYSSVAFNVEGTLVDDYQIPMGTHLSAAKFDTALSHWPTIQRHAEEFSVDPYILLAMMTQESGGNATYNANGLMQITSENYTVSQTAVNRHGERVTVSVDLPERQDPDKSIRYAAAYMKRLLDKYDGNALKAIQAYNLGEGTLSYIEQKYPAAWNTQYGWLIYREEARLSNGRENTRSASYGCIAYPEGTRTSGSYWGDSCYLENVLRYYAGNDIERVQEQGASWRFLSGAANFIQSLLPSREGDVPKIDFSENIHYETTEIILRTVAAYENRQYFTDIEDYEQLNFWDEGFMEALGTIGMSLNQLMGLTGAYGEYFPPIVMGPGIYVSSRFGNRIHPIYREARFHAGVDVAAPTGTPLYAIADGYVSRARTMSGGWGKFVKLDHEGNTSSIYAHMHQYIVREGDSVRAGQVIGYVGNTGASTGPHLHFEFHHNGRPVDPISLIERSVAISALDYALKKLGAPYVWGAAGPNAFDCSGLVLWAYQQTGYRGMPRTTSEQYKVGLGVSRQNAKAGDLIYFKNNRTTSSVVDHVGIYLGQKDGVDQMLHAPRPGANVEIRSVYWENMVTIRRHE